MDNAKVLLIKFNLSEGCMVRDHNGEVGVITRRPFTSLFSGTRIEVDYEYDEDKVNPRDLTRI